MERYVSVTDARRELLDLVDRLQGPDRVVITKRGQPRAVMVDFERYQLLEDVAWVLQDPGRRSEMLQAWEEWKRGETVRPASGKPPTVRALRAMKQRSGRKPKS
jgi:prevent-host-death family protein